MLQQMVELFQPYAIGILADETGDVAKIVTEMVLDGMDTAAADWLFDNWDSVLVALAA
jgi:hypothetical protein